MMVVMMVMIMLAMMMMIFSRHFFNAAPMICCVLNADSDVGDDEDGVTAEAMMWLFVMRLFRMRCD